MKRIIITVEDGMVQSAYSVINGNEIDISGQIYTIDYDNLRQGDCPVCSDTVVNNGQNYFCPECGYSTETENALERSIWYWSRWRMVNANKVISI